MMADTGISRIVTTKVIPSVQGCDRGTGSLHEDVGYLGHERTLSVGPRMRERGGDEQKSLHPTPIVVIEQWLCFLLGLVCMACGIWGICMKPGQHALSVYIAWLGSLYMPTLRVTAVVCLGLGVMLARQGLAHL